MRWWSLGVLTAVLLGTLTLALPAPVRAQANAETVTIPVGGMTWVGWERFVESAVSGLPGIIEAQASYREGSVVVEYDPTAVTPAEIADVIVAETYYTVGEPVAGGDLGEDGSSAAGGATAIIKVAGMTDERTASLVTRAVGAVGPAVLLPGAEPAIRDVSLDTAQSTLTVVYDAEQVSPQELVDAVQQETGFQASLVSTTSAGGDAGVDYTPYVVLGIASLFAAALAWPAVSWGRRQLARATAPSRVRRRGGRRGRRGQ